MNLIRKIFSDLLQQMLVLKCLRNAMIWLHHYPQRHPPVVAMLAGMGGVKRFRRRLLDLVREFGRIYTPRNFNFPMPSDTVPLQMGAVRGRLEQPHGSLSRAIIRLSLIHI